MREQMRRRSMRENRPCWICGGDIDYLAPAHDPNSWELDHVKSVARHPELALDPSNARDSHASCNASRGADGMVMGLGKRRKRL
jgi:5-methylcytosine-specific restriction endonuclease McrA